MRTVLALVTLAFLWNAGTEVRTQPARRPNIIFIMTDDHAAHAIGAYGSRVNTTPHLDRLAREGALLTSVFDLVNDPYELHNLYGEPGQDALTATLKTELARLKRDVRDTDQLADVQLPNGVDGPVARLRGK